MVKEELAGPSLVHQAAAGVRWSAAATVGVTVLQTVTLVVLAHLLDPSEFGLLAIMLLVTGLAGFIATMGLSEALVQRAEASREQVDSLYWANIGLGLLVYALMWIVTPAIAGLFGRPELTRMLPAISLVFVFASCGSQFSALLQKALRFRAIALISLVSTASGSVLAVVLAVAGDGVWALIWGQIITAAVSSLLLVGLATKEHSLPSPVFHFWIIKDFLSFGGYLLGSNLANYVASRCDQLIIATALGSRALGFYSMAFNLLVWPTALISVVLTQVAFPVLSRVQADAERMRRGYLRMLLVLASINGPLLFGFAALAPIVVPLVLGDKWVPIVSLVQILALFAFLRSIDSAGGSLLLAMGRVRWTFYWTLSLLPFIAVLVYLGAKVGGLPGVGWALTGVEVVVLFIWYRLLVQKLLGRCLGSYLASFGIPAAFAAAMAAAVYGLSRMIGAIPRYGAAVLLVVAGIVVYVALYWVFQRRVLLDTARLLVSRGGR